MKITLLDNNIQSVRDCGSRDKIGETIYGQSLLEHLAKTTHAKTKLHIL